MRILTICLCIVFAYGAATSQTKGDKRLAALLLSADSVVLVGHEETLGFTLDSLLPIPPPLIINDRPNRAIIHQSRRLSNAAIRTLAILVAEKNSNRTKSSEPCFAPQHTIFIYAKARLSYINLSFACGHSETTANIDFSLDNDSYDSRWDELEAFFREQGITYELEEDSDSP